MMQAIAKRKSRYDFKKANIKAVVLLEIYYFKQAKLTKIVIVLRLSGLGWIYQII